MSLFDFDLSSKLANRTNSADQVGADLPYEDVDLKASDIRKLSNAGSITDFFTRMHYNTSEPMRKTLEDVSLMSKQLQSALEGRRIERIASQENGQFEVYLFEPRSLTVSLRNELVRNFRYDHNKNNPCNYLFVLTSNYRKIEFVLIERSIPTVTWQGKIYQVPSLPQMQRLSTYPHIIQVKPHQPSESALRVLRRFVNTEIDAEMQYEKLLATYIKEEWSTEKLRLNPSYFNNRALFSDYYLLNRLPEREEWTSNDEEAAMTKGYRKIHTLYKNASETYSEQAEDSMLSHLLEPMLRILGFRIQPTIENGISAYSLYAMSSGMVHTTSISKYTTSTRSIDTILRRVSNDEATLEKATVATQLLDTPDIEEKPIAYCLMYAWGRKLDSTDTQRDRLTPKNNPSAIAVALLDSNKVNWVIATNGKQWRLYTTKASSRAVNYYEIDLLDLMAMKPQQSRYGFPYFWLFFRANAFVQQNTYPLHGNESKEQGKVQLSTFLDEVLEEGERHARSLDDQLRRRVFEKIFPYFANGFVAYALHNQLLPANLEMLPVEESDHLLEPFFTGTLTFLYRLLFLSYAEARDLLPVRQNQKYLQHSLESMKLRVATIAGRIEKAINYRITNIYSDRETYLYDTLQTLFHAIDKGNAEMNVPIYNGGLFMTEPVSNAHSSEASAASFLGTHKIPDSYLALGLELMSRTLLEDNISKKRGYDMVFIDYKDLGVRQLGSIYEGLLESKLRLTMKKAKTLRGKQETLLLSHVYLENDHLKRRATGSYYTPDYIVKYIVEQTIGPILTKRLREFSRHLRGMQKELDRQHALPQSGERTPEYKTYKKYQKTVDAFFDLCVLDSAMGSGHFLVEAVDFITDRILRMFEEDRWNPITYELNYTREQILLSTQKQGVIVDVDKLDDVTLLKRRVLKCCIYGVDINPMAVELAKVSLWLHCFTLGAPLPFLDHHIKCGNTLIGENIRAVKTSLSEQLSQRQLTDFHYATGLIRDVSRLSDTTTQEVAGSYDAFHKADSMFAPHKRLLDVWLSKYFGNEGAQRVVRLDAEAIIDNDFVRAGEGIHSINQGIALAREKHFFHWELEFPEAYFSETENKEDQGFDAVISNPPYIRMEAFKSDKPYLRDRYSCYEERADLYIYFLEKTVALLKQEGVYGAITANKYLRAHYGKPIRNFLSRNVGLDAIINFRDLAVFGKTNTYPAIIFFTRSPTERQNTRYIEIDNLSFVSLHSAVTQLAVPIGANQLTGGEWNLQESKVNALLEKVRSSSLTLGEIAKKKILRGLITGYNEAFVIDEQIKNQLISEDRDSIDVIKPYIVGRDIERYHVSLRDRYVLYIPHGTNIDRYPAVKNYLGKFQKHLEERATKQMWYELQQPAVAMIPFFSMPRIIYQEIATYQNFAFLREEYYSNAKCFIIPTEDLGLLALLNSKLIWFWLSHRVSKLRGGAFAMQAQYLMEVPIHRFNIVSSLPELTQALETLSNYIEGGHYNELWPLVDYYLTSQSKQPSIVHDLLALLAQNMIRLNEEKRAIQQDFLTFFENTVGIRPNKYGLTSIYTLKGDKERFIEFAGDYQKNLPALSPSDMWSFVEKNLSRFIHFQFNTEQNIKKRYQESLSRVGSIMGDIEMMDRLIDDIVYKLYELTPEEITLVEQHRNSS